MATLAYYFSLERVYTLPWSARGRAGRLWEIRNPELMKAWIKDHEKYQDYR